MADLNYQFTLLLVDDNPTNLTLLEKIVELDLPQVRVLTASNGEDGLKLATEQQVDGAFIDVQMPKMSGLEMCRELKADPRTTDMPLVLITAHLASPEMRAEGLEVGAYDFISQPISNIEMLARIKVMLRLCQGERAAQKSRVSNKETDPARLRWLNGLLLAAGKPPSAPEQELLKSLAAEHPETPELDESLLLEQLTNKFPSAWRKTFFKLALLERIPQALARKLSEIEEIEAVFDYLQRHNLILAPPGAGQESYSFKENIAQRLRQQARQQLDDAEQQQTALLAADWFRKKNEPLNALACLLQAGQYRAVSQLLSQTGLTLLADRHRGRVLQLLTQIPEEQAVSCGWMSLFTGINHMYALSHEVDTWLELAHSRFVTTGDLSGELLVLSQQLLQDQLVGSQTPPGPAQLQRLRELAAEQLELLDPFSRLKVLFAQGLAELVYAADLSSCDQIITRALPEALREQQFEAQIDLSLLRSLLGLYQGRLRVARSALEQALAAANRAAADSLPAQIFWVAACELSYACGDLDGFDQCAIFARQSWGKKRLQRSSFGPLLNFHSGLRQLALGNHQAAVEEIDLALINSPAAARSYLQSWLLQLRGYLRAISAETEEADKDCREALELSGRHREGFLVLPNLLLAGATLSTLGQHQEAIALLQRGLLRSTELNEERYRSGFHAWLAATLLDSGEDAAAGEQLKALFERLRQNPCFFALTPDLLDKLLPLATQLPEAAETGQQLARRWLDCSLTGDHQRVPLAQVQVLGGFRFHLDGDCCDLSEVGQSSRQLLALLAVAPNCSMSTEVLMGTMWPESPSGKARNNFDTALARLRKALEACFGNRIRGVYLELDKGMLLLRNLEIEGAEFIRLVGQARRQQQRQNYWQAELLLWRAEQLWRGEFLAGFELDADLPYCRDHYNQLRLEQLLSLAEVLCLRAEYTEASRLLQAGLQLEPTHDILVQKLLGIYQQQGEKRAMRQLLDNYRSALQEEDYDPDEIDELLTTFGPQWLDN